MNKDLDWRTAPETEQDCSDAPSVVANPSEARRFSYHQDQLRVDPTYKGQLDIWSDDEKRAIFRDLLGAFMLREHQYPLPCVGLPGFPRKDYDIDEPAAELLLKGLQTGHHEKLEILAICEGGQPREREYHETFSKRRVNGEWFERCPEIEAEIERLSNDR